MVGYTDHPTSCNRHPSIEQCGDLVVLDWMGDAIPDMEAFEDAPMLDLKEALYWFTRSFIIAGMYGVKDVQLYRDWTCSGKIQSSCSRMCLAK